MEGAFFVWFRLIEKMKAHIIYNTMIISLECFLVFSQQDHIYCLGDLFYTC